MLFGKPRGYIVKKAVDCIVLHSFAREVGRYVMNEAKELREEWFSVTMKASRHCLGERCCAHSLSAPEFLSKASVFSHSVEKMCTYSVPGCARRG